MRVLATLVVVLAVGFLAVMGFYYWRDGSMETAGAKVDEALESVDRTTKPLQDSVGEVGDATKETLDRATDGDDRT